jgi:uncharacterized protein (TIGR02246 family)
MGVRDPRDISAAFGRHFNARDKAGLLSLYEDAAVFTLDGATVARGKGEIEQAMGPILEGPLKIKIGCTCAHQAGDTAIVRSDWTLTAPDGSVASTGASAEVLHKSADGLWRFIIDDASFASRKK